VRKTTDIHVEDEITANVKQKHSEIERISIKQGPNGWTCFRLWRINTAPPPSDEETKAILALANVTLADIMRKTKIVQSRQLEPEMLKGLREPRCSVLIDDRWRALR
jgi:hypothetical protein